MKGSEAGAAAHPSDAGLRMVRRVGVFTWLLGVAALIELTAQSYRTGVLQVSAKWQAALTAGFIVTVAMGIGLALAARYPVPAALIDGAARIDALVRRRGLSLVLIAITVLVYPLAVFGPAGRYFDGIFPRLFLFWLVTLALSVLLRAWFPRASWIHLLLGTTVTYGLLVRVLAFVPEISTYPFSLGWSEGSRYYYASLFRSQALYGQRLSPSELHPTRYLLQSLPFFVASLPLWTHRLWQVLLWWLLPVVTAALLVARHRVSGHWTRFLVGGWIVLYLFQGPVYYHLLVAVVLVLAGLDVHHPWRSTMFVVAASVWAGISRLNWFPVPALLAGCLYLLESPPEKGAKTALRWPIVWAVIGTLVAFAAQGVYVRVSGIELDRLTSSLSSALLFYRLLPNPTYALGILPAVIMASAPLLLSLWWSRPQWLARLDGPRRAFLAGALSVLAFGGVLVSLKIGGGSNLHNLDAYLVLLLLVGSSLLLQSTEGGPALSAKTLPAFRQAALIVAVPVAFAVWAGGTWVQRDLVSAERALSLIRREAQQVSASGEDVLFISQRHLLPFGMVPGIPLEPEYETVFLMEMAMAGNRAYLDRFHSLLEGHAFGMIVVDRLGTTLQGRSHGFGEENDAWVREVALPILCDYRFLARLETPPVDLLVPRPEAQTVQNDWKPGSIHAELRQRRREERRRVSVRIAIGISSRSPPSFPVPGTLCRRGLAPGSIGFSPFGEGPAAHWRRAGRGPVDLALEPAGSRAPSANGVLVGAAPSGGCRRRGVAKPPGSAARAA
jgi:hypothetical protein